MYWEFTLLFIALAVGVVIGIYIERKHNVAKKVTHGIINVDCGDPANGPYLYLDLAVPIAEVVDQKRVIFDVRVLN